MRNKILSLFCIAFIAFSLLSGCVVDKREILSVGNTKITKGEFMFYLDGIKQLMAQDAALNITDEESWQTVEIGGKKAIDVAKDKALDEVVKIALQVEKAKESGIKLDENDKRIMGRQKNSVIQTYGGTDNFNAQLSKWGLGTAGFDKIVENYMYSSKYREQVTSKEGFAGFSEEQINYRYQIGLEQTLNQTARIKHVLIGLSLPDGTQRTPEAAEALANEVLAKAQAGEDFDKLVEDYSEDPGSKTYPEGYTFQNGDGQMIPEFNDAAFEIQTGEISGLVRTDFGYHILKRYPVEVPEDDYENSRDSVIESMILEKYDAQLEELKKAAVITKNDELLASIK